jgi:hypothetical protein
MRQRRSFQGGFRPRQFLPGDGGGTISAPVIKPLIYMDIFLAGVARRLQT